MNGLLRVDGGSGLVAAVTAIQRATVMRFVDAAQRAQQLPTPAVGALTFLADLEEFEWWDGGAWQPLAGAGGGGDNEVAVQADDPGVGFDLWYDTDAEPPAGGGGGAVEVAVQADEPDDVSILLWYDTDAVDVSGPPVFEVAVTTVEPPTDSTYVLWYDPTEVT